MKSSDSFANWSQDSSILMSGETFFWLFSESAFEEFYPYYLPILLMDLCVYLILFWEG